MNVTKHTIKGFIALIGVSVGLIAQCSTAHAWYDSGHSFIGELAWSQMTPDAKKMVKSLLRSGNDVPVCKADIISTASNWLDCARSHKIQPFSEVYHFDSVMVCEGMVLPSKCDTGHCGTDALKAAIVDLENPRNPTQKRRNALNIVLHLVGDLHQPLHVGTTADAGGGKRLVMAAPGEKPMTLHQYWDGNLMSQVTANKRYVYALIKTWGAQMKAGTIEDWTRQTAQEAKTMVYGELLGDRMCLPLDTDAPPILMTKTYEKHAYILMQRKLAEAGIRLAAILNTAAQKPAKQ